MPHPGFALNQACRPDSSQADDKEHQFCPLVNLGKILLTLGKLPTWPVSCFFKHSPNPQGWKHVCLPTENQTVWLTPCTWMVFRYRVHHSCLPAPTPFFLQNFIISSSYLHLPLPSAWDPSCCIFRRALVPESSLLKFCVDQCRKKNFGKSVSLQWLKHLISLAKIRSYLNSWDTSLQVNQAGESPQYEGWLVVTSFNVPVTMPLMWR